MAGDRQHPVDVTSILEAVPNRRGLGVFPWAATWTAVPGNGWDPADASSGQRWENQALFGYDDRALPAMAWFAHRQGEGPVVPSRTAEEPAPGRECGDLPRGLDRVPAPGSRVPVLGASGRPGRGGRTSAAEWSRFRDIASKARSIPVKCGGVPGGAACPAPQWESRL
ncbi:hypothetical protein GCM10010254_70090 [Streptomyces chromofuscus]|nr:hypothetical protein GCM10010254_70090 [Streptomyces chromofuscus]